MALTFKKKLDFELEITGSASGKRLFTKLEECRATAVQRFLCGCTANTDAYGMLRRGQHELDQEPPICMIYACKYIQLSACLAFPCSSEKLVSRHGCSHSSLAGHTPPMIPPGTAGLEFALEANAGAGVEYTKASINGEGKWDLFGKLHTSAST